MRRQPHHHAAPQHDRVLRLMCIRRRRIRAIAMSLRQALEWRPILFATLALKTLAIADVLPLIEAGHTRA
jgi:hypothetical protein